jgi:hypothetical protein
MTAEPSFDMPSAHSGIKDAPAEARSWALPTRAGDKIASPTPLRKRAIGWRGRARARG